jgi:cytochrome-b5 reductase
MSDTTGDSMLPPPNRTAAATAAVTVSVSGDGDDTRHMNDSTMPPPRYAAKKRTKATAAVNPRARFGLHDWKRLLQHSNDLAQRKGAPIRRDIPKEEVKQHNKVYDGWIILRGKVYNIGPYLAYHPGGADIFKNVLGKDATSLFDKYHRWVNVDGLVGPLLLGTVDMGAAPKANPFSIVPPKESHLTNAPRVSTQTAGGSSLLSSSPADDDEDEEEEQILPVAY